MDREELENILSYNCHATTMSQIAVNLLMGENPLNVKGIRELIAMYMLIPYITNSQLDTPNECYKIPKLDINKVFTKVQFKDGSLSDMTLGRLRDALCHSFVALTDKGDLMLDDRASCDRKTHDSMTDKGFCNRLVLDKTRQKLLSLHNEILKQQAQYNSSLLKELEVCNE
ncbi:hypothetical protein IKL64_04520 [bacterium]|nr:hypothetical protein [bacterium]